MTICHGSDLSNHHAINYTYRLIDTLVGITKGTFVGVRSFLFCSFQKYAIKKFSLYIGYLTLLIFIHMEPFNNIVLGILFISYIILVIWWFESIK